jgi:hypothetical protein
MTQGDQRPPTGVSITSSVTDVQPEKVAPDAGDQGHFDPTLPQLEKVFGERIQDLEDEWAVDPDNARNWSVGKKWTAVAIVGSFFII